MDGTLQSASSNTPDDLAQMHKNISVELGRLYQETLALQSTLSPIIAKSVREANAMTSLQKLDAHAQILSDLSRILHELGLSAQNHKLNLPALEKLKILPSTAAAIFGHRTEDKTKSTTSGEVTFF